MSKSTPILIGSTFPLSLIRREVQITPRTREDLQAALDGADIHSFWGHDNTLAFANAFAGEDLTPATARPALRLSPHLNPTLNEFEFDTCWVLSPDYEPGYRPGIGEQVHADKIIGWQVLRMEWSQ